MIVLIRIGWRVTAPLRRRTRVSGERWREFDSYRLRWRHTARGTSHMRGHFENKHLLLLCFHQKEF